MSKTGLGVIGIAPMTAQGPRTDRPPRATGPRTQEETMEYFTITDAMSGQDMTARFIGAVQTPHAPHGAVGTAAGRALMGHLKRGRAQDAAEVIGDTGYGMAKDLAWADAELISRIADRPQATPSVISKGGNVMWSGVRVSVCRGIAYVRARGDQVHLFGVCPVLN